MPRFSIRLGSGALEGIICKSVFEMVNEKGGDVKESNLSKTQVYDADESITGTASEIIAVVQVDDVCIGSGKPGPITVSLQKQYMDATRGVMIPNFHRGYITCKFF